MDFIIQSLCSLHVTVVGVHSWSLVAVLFEKFVSTSSGMVGLRTHLSAAGWEKSCSWMEPVCMFPLGWFRACAFMTWCGCVVLVPYQSLPLLACVSTPLCAGTTQPSSCATSRCTGDGLEDQIPESPLVSWFWWAGHILIFSE